MSDNEINDLDKLLSEQNELLERYKTGDHSEDLFTRFFQIHLKIILTACVDYDDQTSGLISQIIQEYREILRNKALKYDFSELTTKELIQVYKNLGRSQSEMKDAVYSAITNTLCHVTVDRDKHVYEIEQAVLREEDSLRQLYELQTKLNGFHIYRKAEFEEFAKIFYRPNQPDDHAKLNGCIDAVATRFEQLNQEVRKEIRHALVTYRTLYSSLTSVIPSHDSDLSKLYSFTRFLLFKLPKDEGL